MKKFLLPLLLGISLLASCTPKKEERPYVTTCQSDDDCWKWHYCTSEGSCKALPITPLCVDGDLSCGSECSVDSDCNDGLFCHATEGCSKLCVQGELSCSNLGVCQENGMCVSTNPDPDATVDYIDDAEVPDETCASVTVKANPVTPTAILIVDQSGSMDADFMGAGSRWDVLRSFLLEQNGLIDSLQERVRFGLAMYSAVSDGDGLPDGECPLITNVAPDFNNYGAISQTYLAANPIDDTPTGDAIDVIAAGITIDPNNPTVFIVATDGEPDRCEELDPQNGQEEAVSAVTRAHDLGITSYIISVGTEVSNQHLQDMANAGLGVASGAEFWVAGDATTLEDALTSIVVENTLSCDIELEGEITEGDACAEGTVLLNGAKLSCGDPNGWELVDPSHIRLLGNACTTAKSSGNKVELEAEFTCKIKIEAPI